MGVLHTIPELACPACKGQLEEESHQLRCTNCDAVYRIVDGIPQMLGEDLREVAEEIAVQDRVAQEYEQNRYERPYSRRYHDWWDQQMLCRVRPDGRTLDNGCGTGRLLQKIKAENVVGLDISSEMLRRARSYSDALILGNSQELPFHDSSFDTVFCRSLLHHLPQPRKAVEEIARVLRPGGEVVFIDTNTSILSVLPRRIARGGDHFSHSHQNLSRRVFEGLLAPDFEIDEIMYFGYLAYPILGFPDLINVFRFFPAKSVVEKILMTLDGLFSKIPAVRTQSWGFLVKATRASSQLDGKEYGCTQ